MRIASALLFLFYSLVFPLMLLAWVGFRPRSRVVSEQIRLAGLNFHSQQYYLHMARLSAEILVLSVAPKSWVKSRVAWQTPANLWKMAKDGGLGLTAHLGNWEWMLAAAGLEGVPLAAIVKRTKSPLVTQLMLRWRSRFGVKILFEEGSSRQMLAHLKDHGLLAVILDQYMGPPIGVKVNFFGRGAGTMKALAQLALKTEKPIYPVFCYRVDWCRFEAHVGEPVSHTKDIWEATQTYTAFIEQAIRLHPDQWLWMHRRWKQDTTPVQEKPLG